jgi:Fe-S-cluster containining protein
MTQPDHSQQRVTAIDRTDTFTFSCHQGVKCFTECCRMLELALTPYDVLRLRMATGLTSSQLLDDYIIIEQEPGEPFPRFYLTMVDDGRASCVFVAEQGCTVYKHRPAACRAYPLGRAVIRDENGTMEEHFVLMKEDHCQGFAEPMVQNALQYSAGQELLTYNNFNDAVAVILQHDSIRKGFIPSAKQIELFILTLYNIDTFREMVLNDRIDSITLTPTEKSRLNNDEKLLLFGIDWLRQQLFSPF